MVSESKCKVSFLYLSEQTQLCGLDSHKSSRHLLSSQEAITDQFSGSGLIQTYQVQIICITYRSDLKVLNSQWFIFTGIYSKRRTEYLSESSSSPRLWQKQEQYWHLPLRGSLINHPWIMKSKKYISLFPSNEIVNIFANCAIADMPVSRDINDSSIKVFQSASRTNFPAIQTEKRITDPSIRKYLLEQYINRTNFSTKL